MDSWHMADLAVPHTTSLHHSATPLFHCERGISSIRTRTLTHQNDLHGISGDDDDDVSQPRIATIVSTICIITHNFLGPNPFHMVVPGRTLTSYSITVASFVDLIQLLRTFSLVCSSESQRGPFTGPSAPQYLSRIYPFPGRHGMRCLALYEAGSHVKLSGLARARARLDRVSDTSFHIYQALG